MNAECAQCHGTGFRVRLDERQVLISVPCECGIARRGAELLRAARIPRRYDHCTFEDFEEPHHPSLQRAKRLAMDWLERCPPLPEQGLLFYGPPGTGKTHLAVALGRELVRSKGLRVLFYEQREMFKALQTTFDGRSPTTESEVLGPIQDVEVLVLDDLGAGRTTPWGREVLHDIIAHRYNRKLPMLITTNLQLEDDGLPGPGAEELSLRSRLGDALMSRLYEMCRMVFMELGKDRETGRQKDYRRDTGRSAENLGI